MSDQSDDDTPVLDLLASMTADSLDASTLDSQTLMITRIAALVAVGAPPASYLLNLGAASEVDVNADTVQGILTAVAPIVGTTRVLQAQGAILRALGLAIEAAVLEEAEAEDED